MYIDNYFPKQKALTNFLFFLNPLFFLKCQIPCLEYSSCPFLCMLAFAFIAVLLFIHCFPLMVEVFPSVLFCKRDLFSLVDLLLLNIEILLLPLFTWISDSKVNNVSK